MHALLVYTACLFPESVFGPSLSLQDRRRHDSIGSNRVLRLRSSLRPTLPRPSQKQQHPRASAHPARCVGNRTVRCVAHAACRRLSHSSSSHLAFGCTRSHVDTCPAPTHGPRARSWSLAAALSKHLINQSPEVCARAKCACELADDAEGLRGPRGTSQSRGDRLGEARRSRHLWGCRPHCEVESTACITCSFRLSTKHHLRYRPFGPGPLVSTCALRYAAN